MSQISLSVNQSSGLSASRPVLASPQTSKLASRPLPLGRELFPRQEVPQHRRSAFGGSLPSNEHAVHGNATQGRLFLLLCSFPTKVAISPLFLTLLFLLLLNFFLFQCHPCLTPCHLHVVPLSFLIGNPCSTPQTTQAAMLLVCRVLTQVQTSIPCHDGSRPQHTI